MASPKGISSKNSYYEHDGQFLMLLFSIINSKIRSFIGVYINIIVLKI